MMKRRGSCYSDSHQKPVLPIQPPARLLADAVGGLPLAIELLGGYLAAPEQATFPDLSQAAIAELMNPAQRLALAQERLGNAADGMQTLEAVIQLSLDDLGRVDTAAVEAFYDTGCLCRQSQPPLSGRRLKR